MVQETGIQFQVEAYSYIVEMSVTQWRIYLFRGARGVMVIVVRNGLGNTSLNPGRDWLHFHIALIPLGKVLIQLFSLQLWVNSRAD